MPRSASQAVGELFVPADQLSAATEEAASLPSVDISTLDLQWVRLLASFFLMKLSQPSKTIAELWDDRLRGGGIGLVCAAGGRVLRDP